MKVLNVIMSLDPVKGGGTVERTFQMSKYLKNAGIDCGILTTNAGLSLDRLNDFDGIKVIALQCINKRFFVPKFSLRKIACVVRNYDLIHIMGHWLFLNAVVYFIARYYRIPYVVCSAGLLQIFGRSRFLKILYNFMIGKRIIRNAHCIIAVTADEIPQILRTYNIDQKKIAVIPNGISQIDFQVKSDPIFLQKHGLKGIPFILCVAALKYIKGPDLLLKAFCNELDRLRPYHLVFVGPDGGMLSKLQELVERYSATDRIHFLGYLGGIEKSKIYHASKLLVIPSRQEAMSIVVLEAGITSAPVLITDQCGFNDISIIEGGKVVPATVEGLQRGLLELTSNTEKLKIMGKKLNAFTRTYFTWDIIIENHLNLYQQIINHPRSKGRGIHCEV